MPDIVRISELTAAAALDGTEVVPVVQDGTTVRTTAQAIADLGGGSGSTAFAYGAITEAGVVEFGVGIASAVRNGPGDYNVTLSGSFPELTSVVVGSLRFASDPCSIELTMSGLNTVNVQITLAADGSFFDAQFNLMVMTAA
jgi:hypothetical protein